MSYHTDKNMNQNYAILHESPIFSQIAPEEISSMLDCLLAREAAYPKGTFLFHYGDTTNALGIVLRGCVHIIKEDFWGNLNLLGKCRPGDIFAESYALRPSQPLEVSILADENTTVLFLNVSRMMTVCSSACRHHNQMIQNLMSVLTEKNLQLSRKLDHITKRTTKEKLLSYLSAESVKNKSASFDIPYNRQQLADYLSVDRSAMSAELGRLKDEGVLDFHKNHFTIFTS